MLKFALYNYTTKSYDIIIEKSSEQEFINYYVDNYIEIHKKQNKIDSKSILNFREVRIVK